MKLLPLAAIALLASPALAQQTQGNPSQMFLQTFDANKDGRVSRDEFVKPQVQQIEKQFQYMDKNGDGSVDAKEADAFAKEMQKRMQRMEKKS